MVRTNKWWTLACAGLLAGAASGCGAMRGGGTASAPADPGAQQVRMAQEQSEKAIDEARDAQRKASEQAQRAAQAQAEVREAQQRLSQAQERARQEQEKAQQLQQEANRATEQAAQRAQSSQEQAAQALARQSDRTERGEQVLSGQVMQATDEQLVVQPQGGGDPMTFRITDETRVEIAGQESSASDIRQGEDARVSYEASGTGAKATTVQVLRSLERR